MVQIAAYVLEEQLKLVHILSSSSTDISFFLGIRKFEQNNQIFATEHDFTPKNLKKLDKFNNENNPNDTNDLENSEMGKVSNQCTCPDRSYANCHRTSRCVRCGIGFCTYGDRHTSDDIIEPHNRQILPKNLKFVSLYGAKH